MTNPPTYLSNPEYRAAAIARLALSFADALRDEIGDDDYAEVCARNATEEYARFCASHDFCDANMVMFDAFNTEIGWDMDLDNDEDTAVWNEAWELARAAYLTAAV
jgi:hypothetical protein